MPASSYTLGTNEAAERLGTSVRAVRDLIRDGKLKARRIKNRYRFSSQELSRYLNQLGDANTLGNNPKAKTKAKTNSKTKAKAQANPNSKKNNRPPKQNHQTKQPQRPNPAPSDASKAHINSLLKSESTAKRRAAVAALASAPDKDAVAIYLAEQLPLEKDQWRRCWMISALAAIGHPDSVQVVAQRLRSSVERSAWVRYWTTIGLAKLNPPNLVRRLKEVSRDRDVLVKAVALRLLAENDAAEAEDAIDRLVRMAGKSSDWEARWAACKVFRRESGLKPLSDRIESKIIPVLVHRLRDKRESMDIHYQAALALGNVVHGWREALDVLSQALLRQSRDWVRRACVDALTQLKRPEAKEALLIALRDEDAEIRVRAANALKNALGQDQAVEAIIDALLREDKPSLDFVVALRRIDENEAARTLSSKLTDPKSEVVERASRALVQLGGEEAARTLQAQRTKAVDTYTKLLGEADGRIMDQFKALMGQARNAFQISMWMHGTIFAMGIVVLAASLWVALAKDFELFERFIGIGGAVGSVGTLLLLFYKDPVKNIARSVTNLVKVNVVFSGYVRQINQIDATFKQLFLASTGFGVDEMKQTVELIQKSVKDTMEEVKTYLSSDQ